MTTIRDVAVRAGVSIATVSRVLNRSDHPVRLDVRERVLRAAAELDFHPSSLARALAGRDTRTLALVVPDIANPYYPRLSRGAEDVASGHGYALLICNTDYSAAKLDEYLRILRDKRVDGVLLAGGGNEQNGAIGALAGASLPIVAVGRHALDAPAVRIDNVLAAEMATSHLLALGRRRIAVLGGPRDHTTVADRLAGYRRALGRVGLAPARELEGDFTPRSGQQAVAQLLTGSCLPDGLFCANDSMAIGALVQFRRAGVRIPEDVAIVGFDDVPLAEYVEPGLTSVAVPAYELGATAATMLVSRLSGRAVDTVVWLRTTVVVRGSTVTRDTP
ncbi:MAG: LacI family DNA-binding transcriptional regulator [Chloroflexi bacterium]|nr:LacI family DNA-binding transcriptional regulator [Chloroflexota bacterium]